MTATRSLLSFLVTDNRFGGGSPDLFDQLVDAVDAGDAEKAMSLTGGEDRHRLLAAMWDHKLIGQAELRRVILCAWTHGPRHHGRDLGPRKWRQLFAASGFVSEPDHPPPDDDITIYRGAPAWTRGRGMSWSTSRETAAWFRDRWRLRKVPAEVYATTVPPTAVWGMSNGRNENEVIINPAVLRGKRTPKVEASV